MARQATAPVQFEQSVRVDEGVLMSSGRAGVVFPVMYAPILRGDSAAGRISVDFALAEMPRPLLNSVFVNVQAWFVPKSIHPQFAGEDEFMASYAGTQIKAVGQADRNPPAFFRQWSGGAVTAAAQSAFFKTLGIHLESGDGLHADVTDAFALIYNFRLAAHSTKLPRIPYAGELNASDWLNDFPKAFWPSGRFARMVPDYEREIVIGALDMDVSAGKIPLMNLIFAGETQTPDTGTWYNVSSQPLDQPVLADLKKVWYEATTPSTPDTRAHGKFNGETLTSSLADIDKARLTQSFAKLRQAMAGNNGTGFVSDEAILAHLMQGLAVPESQFKRPWLLNSKRVPFGFAERFATDADALDQSVTTGRSAVEMSINIPRSESGGTIIVTAEVLPERLDERQKDEWLAMVSVASLPNALRDIRNPEPVDFVENARIDAKHAQPDALYGFEPMNDKWNRSFTRLGGAFYQPTPGAPVTDQRMGIWQASVVNPTFTQDHWLAPAPFPHYVFSDTQAPAFEFTTRHSLKIVGNTQIGDVLAENNNEYDDTVNTNEV